jgi:hypothetical protein
VQGMANIGLQDAVLAEMKAAGVSGQGLYQNRSRQTSKLHTLTSGNPMVEMTASTRTASCLRLPLWAVPAARAACSVSLVSRSRTTVWASTWVYEAEHSQSMELTSVQLCAMVSHVSERCQMGPLTTWEHTADMPDGGAGSVSMQSCRSYMEAHRLYPSNMAALLTPLMKIGTGSTPSCAP